LLLVFRMIGIGTILAATVISGLGIAVVVMNQFSFGTLPICIAIFFSRHLFSLVFSLIGEISNLRYSHRILGFVALPIFFFASTAMFLNLNKFELWPIFFIVDAICFLPALLVLCFRK
jgi:hypothetical protein